MSNQNLVMHAVQVPPVEGFHIEATLKLMRRTETAYPRKLREELSMSGYEGDANGNGPAGLNTDGGAVKEPLKPKGSGKADVTSPTFDRNSMVCLGACTMGMALHVKRRHACYKCIVHCILTALYCTVYEAIIMLLGSLKLGNHAIGEGHGPGCHPWHVV